MVTMAPLCATLLQVLSPLQCSRLLVGVSPYLPDWLQLCALLEWQQQPSSIGCHAA